jgi:hypothetical protein
MCGCLLDQRISFVFVATVRLFVRDFFSLPMQVDGYGRRGTLQTFRSFPPRRFRRARMPLHPIACAHCIALQTWPRTPPRAPYFRIPSWKMVPTDRIGSVGHHHAEIASNFIHYLLRYRPQPQPICMLLWTVHLLTYTTYRRRGRTSESGRKPRRPKRASPRKPLERTTFDRSSSRYARILRPER